MFTLQHIKELCSFERKFLRLKTTAQSCGCHSIGYYIGVLRDTSCEYLVQSDVDNMLDIIKLCASYFYNRKLTDNCNAASCPKIPRECYFGNAVYRIMYYLTDKNFTDFTKTKVPKLTYSVLILPNSRKDLEEIYYKNLQNTTVIYDGIKVAGIGFQIDQLVFNTYLIEDIRYLFIGLGLVLFVTVIYLQSVMITIVSSLVIGFAGILAYFFYFMVFRMTFFPFLNICALVVLIGIGADDVYVIHDVWTQLKGDNRVVDYKVLLYETFSHAIYSVLITTLTTAGSFFANLISEVTAVKCFGIFAGTCLLCNFIILIAVLPSCLLMSEKILAYCQEKSGRCQTSCCYSIQLLKICNIIFAFPRLLATEWTGRLVSRYWHIFIFSFTATGVVGLLLIFLSPKLLLPTRTTLQMFRYDHPFERYQNEIKQHLHGNEPIRVRMGIVVTWGISGVDNGNYFNPKDDGTLEFTAGANFFDDKFVFWMSHFCEALKKSNVLGYAYKSTCMYTLLQEGFRKCHMISEADCCNRGLYNRNISHAEYCVLRMNFLNITAITHGIMGYFHYDKSLAIRAFSLYFITKQEFSRHFLKMDTNYKLLETFMEGTLESAPSFVKSGFFSGPFAFYDFQRSLSIGVYYSTAVSLLIAFLFMIVTTRNIIISVYAIVTITLANGVTIGILVIIDWELNILEALVITLSVGLSIDFTIHYGVAYMISKDLKREEKVMSSFKRVGLPVVMATITTLLAGVSVLPSVVQPYYQFGIFLIIVMIVSWLYGTFFFQSLCYRFGPQGDLGQIRLPCKSKYKDDMEPDYSISSVSDGSELYENVHDTYNVIPRDCTRFSDQKTSGRHQILHMSRSLPTEFDASKLPKRTVTFHNTDIKAGFKMLNSENGAQHYNVKNDIFATKNNLSSHSRQNVGSYRSSNEETKNAESDKSTYFMYTGNNNAPFYMSATFEVLY